jgi:hypothetical protein
LPGGTADANQKQNDRDYHQAVDLALAKFGIFWHGAALSKRK